VRIASHERDGLASGPIAVATLSDKINFCSALSLSHRPGPLSASTNALRAASRSPLAKSAARRSLSCRASAAMARLSDVSGNSASSPLASARISVLITSG
jgi:hypothetical protein